MSPDAKRGAASKLKRSRGTVKQPRRPAQAGTPGALRASVGRRAEAALSVQGQGHAASGCRRCGV